MSEENGVDAPMEGQEQGTAKEESEEPPRLLKGRAHFYFNVNHSLRMVIVNPLTESAMNNLALSKACQDAYTFTISKNKENKMEAVLYFQTMDKGDAAFIDLKTAFADDEECVVTHPNFMLSLSAGQYWSQLSTLSSIAVPPISTTEAKLETLFSRQIILEKTPELTDEQLYEKFPEASSVLTYPHAPNTKGIFMLEFKSDIDTNKFVKARVKNGKIDLGDGVEIEARLYGTRMQTWKKEKKEENPKSDQLKEHTLEDEERVEACRQLKEAEEIKLTVLNKTDLFSDEKIVELIRMHNELQPLKESIKGDTNRRKREKLEFPEPEELRTAYTKFALSPGYQKKVDANKQGGKSTHFRGSKRGKPYDNRQGSGYGRGRNQGYGNYGQSRGYGYGGGNRGYGGGMGYGGGGDQLTKAIEGLADALSGNMMGYGSNYGATRGYPGSSRGGRGWNWN